VWRLWDSSHTCTAHNVAPCCIEGIQSTAPLRAAVIGYDAGWTFAHPRPFGRRNDGTINRSKTGGPLCPPQRPAGLSL
jgi:hypothetical protein